MTVSIIPGAKKALRLWWEVLLLRCEMPCNSYQWWASYRGISPGAEKLSLLLREMPPASSLLPERLIDVTPGGAWPWAFSHSAYAP